MTETSKQTRYLFATIASPTQRGGRVTTASSPHTICGLQLALAGDVVTYEDGSEAVIIESLQKSGTIIVCEDDGPEGLFDSTYVPPVVPPSHRLAVRGTTTQRGGVLREPTSKWNSTAPHGESATIGDVIHYADGSTARIIEGLTHKDSPHFKPLAFVGAALDNGDVITDSPERKSSINTGGFIVVRSREMDAGSSTR